MVCRYVELNTVRAAMVALPQEYRWSSVHSHIGKAREPLVTLDSIYSGAWCDVGRAGLRVWQVVARRDGRRGDIYDTQLHCQGAGVWLYTISDYGPEGIGPTCRMP